VERRPDGNDHSGHHGRLLTSALAGPGGRVKEGACQPLERSCPPAQVARPRPEKAGDNGVSNPLFGAGLDNTLILGPGAGEP
jgi:hypothetical protein